MNSPAVTINTNVPSFSKEDLAALHTKSGSTEFDRILDALYRHTGTLSLHGIFVRTSQEAPVHHNFEEIVFMVSAPTQQAGSRLLPIPSGESVNQSGSRNTPYCEYYAYDYREAIGCCTVTYNGQIESDKALGISAQVGANLRPFTPSQDMTLYRTMEVLVFHEGAEHALEDVQDQRNLAHLGWKEIRPQSWNV